MSSLNTVADLQDKEVKIRKSDNGGFILSYTVEKEDAKKDEYPYENKTQVFDDKVGLFKCLSDLFSGKDNSSGNNAKDYLNPKTKQREEVKNA